MTKPLSQGQECTRGLSKQSRPSPLKKLSVHLILLQFHPSTHKPPQSTPPLLPQEHSCSFLFAFSSLPSSFFPSADLTHSHSLRPPQLLSRGVYFMPRWLDRLWVISQGGGLNFGQELAVWSDVSAGSSISVSACVGVYKFETPSRKGQLHKCCSE